MQEVILEWQGAYQLSDFMSLERPYNEFETTGVYMFIMNDANGLKAIDYIGRALGNPNLSTRMVWSTPI